MNITNGYDVERKCYRRFLMFSDGVVEKSFSAPPTAGMLFWLHLYLQNASCGHLTTFFNLCNLYSQSSGRSNFYFENRTCALCFKHIYQPPVHDGPHWRSLTISVNGCWIRTNENKEKRMSHDFKWTPWNIVLWTETLLILLRAVLCITGSGHTIHFHTCFLHQVFLY